MFREIYIIDCENELAMMLREKFEKEKRFKFKNIKPSKLEVALKSIPDLIIVNEESIDIDIIELCKSIRENEDNSILFSIPDCEWCSCFIFKYCRLSE